MATDDTQFARTGGEDEPKGTRVRATSSAIGKQRNDGSAVLQGAASPRDFAHTNPPGCRGTRSLSTTAGENRTNRVDITCDTLSAQLEAACSTVRFLRETFYDRAYGRLLVLSDGFGPIAGSTLNSWARSGRLHPVFRAARNQLVAWEVDVRRAVEREVYAPPASKAVEPDDDAPFADYENLVSGEEQS